MDPSLEWLVSNGHIPPFGRSDLSHLELELALAAGSARIHSKMWNKYDCTCLSGGRDSAMCALLVARMVAYDNRA